MVAKHYDGVANTTAGSLKCLVFLGKIHRKSLEIVSYDGDSKLLRHSIFSTAGSFGQSRCHGIPSSTGGISDMCRSLHADRMKGFESQWCLRMPDVPCKHSTTPLVRNCSQLLEHLFRKLEKAEGKATHQKTTHPNKNSLHKQLAQTLLSVFCLF